MDIIDSVLTVSPLLGFGDMAKRAMQIHRDRSAERDRGTQTTAVLCCRRLLFVVGKFPLGLADQHLLVAMAGCVCVWRRFRGYRPWQRNAQSVRTRLRHKNGLLLCVESCELAILNAPHVLSCLPLCQCHFSIPSLWCQCRVVWMHVVASPVLCMRHLTQAEAQSVPDNHARLSLQLVLRLCTHMFEEAVVARRVCEAYDTDQRVADRIMARQADEPLAHEIRSPHLKQQGVGPLAVPLPVSPEATAGASSDAPAPDTQAGPPPGPPPPTVAPAGA